MLPKRRSHREQFQELLDDMRKQDEQVEALYEAFGLDPDALPEDVELPPELAQQLDALDAPYALVDQRASSNQLRGFVLRG